MIRGRILYIEDNFENRILIKRILESEGYTVFEAENGTSGLRMAETVDPDLILIDINLPDIDGYHCTTHLRTNHKLDRVPIVALTANVMEGDRQKAFDSGCDGYIPKPIDVDQLPHQVAGYLHRDSERKPLAPARPAPPPPAAPTLPPKPTGPLVAGVPPPTPIMPPSVRLPSVPAMPGPPPAPTRPPTSPLQTSSAEPGSAAITSTTSSTHDASKPSPGAPGTADLANASDSASTPAHNAATAAETRE